MSTIDNLSLEELKKQYHIYAQVGLNQIYETHDVSYYASNEKVLALGKVKKDYFQELSTMGYHGDYGLFPLGTNWSEQPFEIVYHRINRIINIKETWTTARAEKVNDEEMNLYIEEGIEYFICHPDWKTKTLSIYYKLPGDTEYRYIKLHSDKKLMERYLFAFVISTTRELFSIDSAGKESVVTQ